MCRKLLRDFDDAQDVFAKRVGIDQFIGQLCAVDHRSKALREAFGSSPAISSVLRGVELSKSARPLPRSRPSSVEMRSVQLNRLRMLRVSSLTTLSYVIVLTSWPKIRCAFRGFRCTILSFVSFVISLSKTVYQEGYTGWSQWESRECKKAS
jgi:hypothetical protein